MPFGYFALEEAQPVASVDLHHGLDRVRWRYEYPPGCRHARCEHGDHRGGVDLAQELPGHIVAENVPEPAQGHHAQRWQEPFVKSRYAPVVVELLDRLGHCDALDVLVGHCGAEPH